MEDDEVSERLERFLSSSFFFKDMNKLGVCSEEKKENVLHA